MEERLKKLDKVGQSFTVSGITVTLIGKKNGVPVFQVITGQRKHRLQGTENCAGVLAKAYGLR